jgi:ABC-2 type transport system permease protein
MSATTAPTFASPLASHRVSFPRLLHSEWRKLWSLRSTWWVLGIAVVILIGFALLFAWGYTSSIGEQPDRGPGAAAGGIGAATVVTFGYSFAVVVAASLGALSITGEYSTGMIRATLSAAPTRLPVLVAKSVIIGAITFVVTLAATAVAILVTHPMLSNHDMTIDFSDAVQVRSLLGTALYVATVSVFAIGVGTLVRSTPGTIVIIVALFFLVPQVFSGIAQVTNQGWAKTINQWLPSSAGERIITDLGAGGGGFGGGLPLFDAWPGYLVFAGYTVALLVAAAISLGRRDA